MNDDQISRLTKRSLLHTSDQFTDDLMKKIQIKSQLSRQFYKFSVAVTLCCVVLLTMIFDTTLTIDLTYAKLILTGLGFKVVGVLFVMIAGCWLLAMKRELDNGI